MGKQERGEALRKLQGKQLWSKTFRFSDLLDVFAYPYRAWKEKKRQEEIRKRIIGQMIETDDFTKPDGKDFTDSY